MSKEKDGDKSEEEKEVKKPQVELETKILKDSDESFNGKVQER